MASRTEVANFALGILGQYRIADIDERSAVAEVVRDRWNIVRDASLEAHHWNFATAPSSLAELSPAPAFGWNRRFALPPDFVKLVSVNGILAGTGDCPFEIQGRELLSNEGEMRIKFVRRVENCELWPAEFIEFFAARLAAKVAPSLTLSSGASEILASAVQDAGERAAHSDNVATRPHVRRAEEGSRYLAARAGCDPIIG